MGLNMIDISRSCPMPPCHKHQHISLKLVASPIILILQLCLMPSSSLMLVHTPTEVYKQEVSEACVIFIVHTQFSNGAASRKI